jgi:RimJ/RimL family protein N-acetyltransferase
VTKANPNLFTYVSFPILDTKEHFIEFYDKHIGSPPEECLYAIFDKIGTSGKGDSDRGYAGTIALSATNRVHAATELGVLIFPAFQRTHVATNAIGLVLLWTLDPPSLGGLGLRRVEWKTHA